MVYTLSLNPAVDYYIGLGSLSPNTVNQTGYAICRAAGKGVNVSKMLYNLGVPSTALGFAGGFTGSFIREELKNYGICGKFTELEGNTRINIKLTMGGTEHEISGISPEISQASLLQLQNMLGSVSSGDIVVFSGSIPESLPPDFYALAAKKLPKGVITVLDTRASVFMQNIYGNFLAKPNIHELEETFQTRISGIENIVFYGNKIIEAGVKNVIVSLGSGGAVFLNEKQRLYAKAPKGKLVNSTGAGDAMVAGFLYGLVSSLSVEGSFKMAAACGSGAAFSSCMPAKPLVLRLFDEIVLENC